MKILLVDDVEKWRKYHRQVLENLFDNVEFIEAGSANHGYDKLLENAREPFDIIITDLQMETSFEPMLAGEWFVEQIQNFPEYKNSKVLIISASYNIEFIAEKYGVEYIRKSTAINFPDAYDFLKKFL